jgi:cytidyltransferase-like protein
MKVHYDLKQLPSFKNAVITTGAFDGVHTGHLQIIKRIKEIAQQVAGESVIITFHPHPRKIISSIPCEIKQLTCLDERIQLLEKANIDHLVVINFDYLFSNLTAAEYVQDFLVAHFHPHTIIVGYDHHFGKGRMGNFDLLVSLGETHHFNVEEINRLGIKFHDQKRIDETNSQGFYGNVPLNDDKEGLKYDVGSSFYEDVKKNNLRVGRLHVNQPWFVHYEGSSWQRFSGDKEHEDLGSKVWKMYQVHINRLKEIDIRNFYIGI